MTAQTINKSRSLLGANDLTLIAPIKPGLVPAPDARSYTTRLKVLLRTLQAARISSKEATKVPAITDVVDQIRAIRAFRLAIVGPEQNQLLLAVSFDGPWESYMRQIWRDMGPLLDVMFCNCDGYLLSHEHSYADYLGWVRSAQATTEYFYESSLLTVSDMHVLREQARAAIEPHVTPTTQPVSAQETISQSMPALVALFGLTDLFPPQAGNADGNVLWRAARLLLKDLEKTGDSRLPQAARTPTEQAAWRWFFADRGGKPRQPLPDPAHDDLPDQVQGGILAPYPGVTHGALVLLELADGAAAQALLDTLLGTVSTARAAQGAQRERSPGDPRVFHNLAFTPAGLKRCGLGDGQTAELPPAFRDGMAARSGVLGDWDHNHPSRWALPRHRLADDGGPQRVQLSNVHAVLQVWLQDQPSDDWSDPVSAQARQRLHAEVERLEQAIAALEPVDARSRRGAGVRVLAVEPMQRLSASSTDLPKGHFGYADGISQPWTRAGGRAPYNTDQDEVPLGDLLLGYGNGLLDDPQTGTLWVNGSFLVVRKLHQNVLAWRQALARDPDNRAAIEQQLMGRTVEGLVDLPGHPGALDNDFDYINDPLGTACPFHAHIRRANPRTPRRPDLVRVPRIMRRGMSYGPRLASHATQDDGEDRGMVFMAYNASIPEQFEVIQSWLAGGNSADAERTWSGLRDPFLGIPQPGDPRTVPYRDAKGVERGFQLPDDPLVTLQWGLYLFMPSMDALRELRAMARHAAESEQLTRDRQAAGTAFDNNQTPKPVRDRSEVALQRKWARESAVGAALIARLKAAEGVLGTAAAVDRWKAVLDDLGAHQSGATRAVWTAIRQTQGGCLRTPYGVLVGSAMLVDQVLQDAERRYSVSGYAARMGKSFGRIYLGLDPGADYDAASEPTNKFIMKLTVENGFDTAWRHAQGALAELAGLGTTLQIRDLVDVVLARISKDWFGLPNGTHVADGGWRWQGNEAASCPGHFMAPSRYMFWPQPGPESEQLGQQHGKVLKARVLDFVRTQRKANPPACGLLGDRMLQAIDDDDRLASTLIGVMMGFLPTVDGNLRLVLAEWIQDGSLWSLQARYLGAIGASPSDAQRRTAARRLLSPELTRSMQRHPVPPIIWRTALQAHTLGGVQINPGDRIAVGLGSATLERLDSDLLDPYTVFGGRRAEPGDQDAGPTHACPGRNVAMGVLLGVLAAVLDRSDLRPSDTPTALEF